MDRKLFVTGISFQANTKAAHHHLNKIQYLKDTIPKIVKEAEESLGKDAIIMIVLPEYELTKFAISNDQKKEYLNQLQEIIKDYKNVILVPGSLSTYEYYRKYVEDYAKLTKILKNYEHLAKIPIYSNDDDFQKHYQDFKDFIKKVEVEFKQGKFPSIDYVVLKNQSYILLSNSDSQVEHEKIRNKKSQKYKKHKKSAPHRENQTLWDQNQLSIYKIEADSPTKKIPLPNNEGELNIGITICREIGIVNCPEIDFGQNTHIQIIPSDWTPVCLINLFGAINIHIDSRLGLSVLIDDEHPASSDFKEIQAKHYQIFKSHHGIIEEEVSVPIKHFDKKLYTAVKLGNVEKVKKLLDRGVDINLEIVKGIDALTIATRNNDFHMVNLLLHYGANPTYALYKATKKGNVCIAELLLNYGANKNLKMPLVNLLALATRNNDFYMVNLLLKYGTDPNYALFEATKNGNVYIAELALHYKAKVNLEMAPGIDALTIATRNNDLNTVNLLLHYGANPAYALYEAIKNGNVYIAELLLNYGANKNLKMPLVNLLTLATRNNDFYMVNLLLKYNANPAYFNSKIKVDEAIENKIVSDIIVSSINNFINTNALSTDELNAWNKLKKTITDPANGNKTITDLAKEEDISIIKPSFSVRLQKPETKSCHFLKELLGKFKDQKLNLDTLQVKLRH